MSATRVGIVAKSHLKVAAPHLTAIATWLRERGIEPIFERATAGLADGPAPPRCVDKASLVDMADIIIVLGGDGTLLSTADCIAARGGDVPILGVNFGSLGFLTEVTLSELYPALEAAIDGRARIEARMMLRSRTTRAGAQPEDHLVLNDVVVTKGARSRMIDLSVWVGDEFVTRIKADGLIVATPTGSTAYNLAAGGPIVQPAVDALVITPIAPHTLTNRPIVIPSSEAVRVQPNIEDRDELFVTFDGQAGYELKAGDEVCISRAERALRLIRPTTRSYFEVLREKLKWGAR